MSKQLTKSLVQKNLIEAIRCVAELNLPDGVDKVPKITEKTLPKDELGLGSLNMVEVLVELEFSLEDFGISFDAEKLIEKIAKEKQSIAEISKVLFEDISKSKKKSNSKTKKK